MSNAPRLTAVRRARGANLARRRLLQYVEHEDNDMMRPYVIEP
jgi:hypothetical protein